MAMAARTRLPWAVPMALTLIAAGLPLQAAPEPSVATLTLEPQGAEKTAPGYYPVQVALSPEKPPRVTKEPQYRGKPKYGTVALGGEGGPVYVIALDEPDTGEWKIYLDANRNGDLTDDGDGAWSQKRTQGARTLYGINRYILDTAWKLPEGKTAEGKYGLAFYRLSNIPALLMYREGARTGTLAVAGKSHHVALIENDGDALFSKPVATAAEAQKSRAVWLLVDLNDDGKFDASGGELFDVRAPFKLAGQTYETTISPDGATLRLNPTTKEALDLAPKAEAPPPLLAKGTVAPNFQADLPGGGKLDLAKYRGKIVILDFWATWCGPCQLSMPHVEKVYQAVKDQPVVVLAVCVFDERENFAQWLPKNKSKYHFQFAFDPAGQDNEKSIAGKLYQAVSIPTTYVIDKTGKVADAIPGFIEGDTRLETALKKLGVKLKSQATP